MCFQLEHLQHSFVPVQPDHPVIDAAVLQEGYALISNQSAAFYKKKKTHHRSARSAETDLIPIPEPCLHQLTYTSMLAPFSLLVLIFVSLFALIGLRRSKR